MDNDLNVRRARVDVTQKQLADAVSVTRQTINAIERGRYDPSLELAFALAEFFDCDIEDIFYPETNLEVSEPCNDVVPRLRAYLDRLSRAILLLGGAFLVVTEVVGSLRVCAAGESCPPVVTPEAIVTATFGAVLLDVSRRFQPA